MCVFVYRRGENGGAQKHSRKKVRCGEALVGRIEVHGVATFHTIGTYYEFLDRTILGRKSNAKCAGVVDALGCYKKKCLEEYFVLRADVPTPLV